MAFYGVLYRVHPLQVTRHPGFKKLALNEQKFSSSVVDLEKQLVSEGLIEPGLNLKDVAVQSLKTRSLIQRMLFSVAVRRVLTFGAKKAQGTHWKA